MDNLNFWVMSILFKGCQVPVISTIMIFMVIFWGSKYMVNQIRQADFKRSEMYHQMEHTHKIAALGRLAAGVAHEINNPLAIINQKAGLQKDLLSFSKELPPKERMIVLIDDILTSVERCGTITHRLLGFAKHMDVKKEEINLEILIKEVLSFLEKEANYRSIDIVFHIEEDIQNIKSDRGQLQQVFLNIINNAFAAVNDGGKIEISIANFELDYVQISIDDDGVGICEENLKHIFEPFFTSKNGIGTGLGLSITYGIVHKLGGCLDVKSEPDKGTCFVIMLPINHENS